MSLPSPVDRKAMRLAVEDAYRQGRMDQVADYAATEEGARTAALVSGLVAGVILGIVITIVGYSIGA